MYMWREFDLAEVRDDMAHIADIGFDAVRLFALTQDFLPAPMTVAPDMIARLVMVTGAAKDAGLRVVPTLIILNMSGAIWWPAWMLDRADVPVNLFSDPTRPSVSGAACRNLRRRAGRRLLGPRLRSRQRDRRRAASVIAGGRPALGVGSG